MASPTIYNNANIYVNWTFPDGSIPYYIRNGQSINLSANGKKYPGPNSYPPTSAMANFKYEVTINVTSGSLGRSNFTLPAGASWVGSTGLTFRCNTNQGALGWPGPWIPGVPPNTDPSTNDNMLVDSDVRIRCNSGSNNATFTISSRFVLPTWNGQTVNWYYTNPVTTPQYTLASASVPLPCTGGPVVQFGYRVKYADRFRPWVIRRKRYGTVKPPGGGRNYRPVMPTNHLELTITNPVNIPVGSTFEFKIINVKGNITSADIGGVTFNSNKVWTRTTASGNEPIKFTLVGKGRQGTEKFKIRITHRPPTRVIGGCTYTYSPVVIETSVITLQK